MCCDDHPQLTALSLRFDSTSSLLSFATALLSVSPAVKAKLHAELDATMPVDPSAFTQDTVRDARTQAPDYASTPSPAQVSTLRYTRAVLDETLRLYPVAYTTARTTVSPVTLSTGVTIPANIHVSIPIAFVHRDPQNWPDEPGSLPTLCLDGFNVFLFKFLTPIAILVPVCVTDAFKPERFFVSDSEAAAGKRDAYPAGAFIPVSDSVKSVYCVLLTVGSLAHRCHFPPLLSSSVFPFLRMPLLSLRLAVGTASAKTSRCRKQYHCSPCCTNGTSSPQLPVGS